MVTEVFARAKINLTLNVLGKRPDGYHEVEMVMQSIELHDRLEFSPGNSGISLVVEGGDLSSGGDNLVYRAAELLRLHTGTGAGARIRLHKAIPVAAGLGGGSSDAAATLSALNKIWGTGLSLDELMLLGGGLGSDVPFCLLGGTALARGRGERLEKLPPCPPLGLVLVKPPFGVSTASVYRSYKAGPTVKKSSQAMVEAIRAKNSQGMVENLTNDLEAVTLVRHPEIAAIKEKLLDAGALAALMSGSGPTVFGLARDLESARAVAARYNRSDELVLVTQTFHSVLTPVSLQE